MKTGIELIAAERERQITKEEWSEYHDDNHFMGELAFAAACYATSAGTTEKSSSSHDARHLGVPKLWPWEAEWWKPDHSDSIHDLVRAGALIAAEIDRIQRCYSLASSPS